MLSHDVRSVAHGLDSLDARTIIFNLNAPAGTPRSTLPRYLETLPLACNRGTAHQLMRHVRLNISKLGYTCRKDNCYFLLKRNETAS